MSFNTVIAILGGAVCPTAEEQSASEAYQTAAKQSIVVTFSIYKGHVIHNLKYPKYYLLIHVHLKEQALQTETMKKDVTRTKSAKVCLSSAMHQHTATTKLAGCNSINTVFWVKKNPT